MTETDIVDRIRRLNAEVEDATEMVRKADRDMRRALVVLAVLWCVALTGVLLVASGVGS